MYNTEKYIGECLDSLLAQTFTAFEIVLIDDCSSDNSPAVVESFIPKFGGRLKVLRLKKNSGNNGIPNNTGFALSRGEYVIFLDSDDTITPDALEKLYTVAKKFDADVVGCEKYYDVPEEIWDNAELRPKIKPFSYQRGGFVTEPTLINYDIAERVKDLSQRKFLWNIWSKLIRRDLLIENKLTITNEMANDMLLSCLVIYCAKKYVRVPYVINYYRVVNSSLTHQKRDPLKQLKKYVAALTVGFDNMDKFLSEREFFQKNPTYKYMAFDTYFREILLYLNEIYGQIAVADLDEALREGFSAADNMAITSFTFNLMNIYRFRLKQLRKRMAELKKVEQQDKAYIAELEKFIMKSQKESADSQSAI